ncbi:hypothetical protein [Halomarina ordinaria]|uniref:Uncharacterized protein n=1 Tax=Halomarina ordinaria TaxID=3033939 RepID=A0ABD5U5H1_9EURY|nr:hypothetical protein [Halomarina sp. PSRA2]
MVVPISDVSVFVLAGALAIAVPFGRASGVTERVATRRPSGGADSLSASAVPLSADLAVTFPALSAALALVAVALTRYGTERR